MDVRWFERFEDYRNGDLDENQKAVLEEELATNPEMKEAFVIYQNIEDNMRNLAQNKLREAELQVTLEDLGSKHFGQESPEQTRVIPLYTQRTFKIISGIAAMLLVFFVAYFLFFQNDPQLSQRAETYYATNYSELGQTMGDQDVMQSGIAAYNEGDYETAKLNFNQVLEADPQNSEAIKNLGVTHLAVREFDGALIQFEHLASREDLFSNPGVFLQALTLLRRNESGDEAQARSLLQRVSDENLAGASQARDWLNAK